MRPDFKKWYAENPLRKWRKENNISMNQCAAMLSISVKSIQLWEQGVYAPLANNFAKISELTEIEVTELIEQWETWKAKING